MVNGTVSVIQAGANGRQEQAAGNAADAKEGSFPERRREDRCGGRQGDHCHGSARALNTSFLPTLISAYSVATPGSLCSSRPALVKEWFFYLLKEDNGHPTAFSRPYSSSSTHAIGCIPVMI
jgi:hypothetical protein